MFRLTILLVVLVAIANALSKSAVLAPFVHGNALKVIAGINQFDATVVKNVVAAACQSGATLVDIACDASLVRMAKTVSGEMPICVSSIKPLDFVACVEAGASMVEIGNFDGFYEQGMQFTAEDVVAMTIETRRLLPNIPLSVTVPHTLPLNEQVALAVRLQQCGADIIQTEGKMSVNPASMGVQELIEKAAPTIARYVVPSPQQRILSSIVLLSILTIHTIHLLINSLNIHQCLCFITRRDHPCDVCIGSYRRHRTPCTCRWCPWGRHWFDGKQITQPSTNVACRASSSQRHGP